MAVKGHLVRPFSILAVLVNNIYVKWFTFWDEGSTAYSGSKRWTWRPRILETSGVRYSSVQVTQEDLTPNQEDHICLLA